MVYEMKARIEYDTVVYIEAENEEQANRFFDEGRFEEYRAVASMVNWDAKSDPEPCE